MNHVGLVLMVLFLSRTVDFLVLEINFSFLFFCVVERNGALAEWSGTVQKTFAISSS